MEQADRQALAARLADGVGEEYTIEGEIGRGGMGVVYLARDLKLKRRVAIKVLPPELAYRSEIKTRFLREAQTAARLSHPHIVPIHGVGEVDGLVYFVMGYVDGESLGHRLKRRGKLPIEEVRRIMKETADALGLAHTMGIIHRDVKPDNILLDGTRRRVMVTDFGIAKALSEVGTGTLTGTGVAIGTPAYMSPEQAAGEGVIDARTDIYALGIVAYEMITGRVPFKAPTVPAILMKQITEAPPDLMISRPECPEELCITIMRCLEKDPEERWATADALRRALDSRSPGTYRPSSARRSRASGSNRERQRPSSSRRTSRSREPAPADWDERAARRAARRSRSGRTRPPLPTRPDKRDRRRPARRDPRQREVARREPRDVERHEATGEPQIVRGFRHQFASYVSFNGSMLFLNALTTGLTPPWFLALAIPWGIGLAREYGKLWSEGYSWRDVIERPPAADAIAARGGQGKKKVQPRLPTAEPDTSEFGKLAGQIRQVQNDRRAVLQIVERLSPSEREMLPDVVPTVDALLSRATDLARTLHSMDADFDVVSVESLDRRIAETETQPADRERDRRLELLRRQRQTIIDLVARKGKVEAQFESCVLAIQNMRFDLLRLRSAGVAAVLEDLTQVTQQAKALNVDINAAIEAAGEVKQILSENAPGN